jgi:predicted SAM-dependent methyltransferase
MRLHLGCGKFRLDDYLNVDIRHTAGADCVADATCLPFRDNTFDHIMSYHSLEHMPFLPTVKELVRVSRNEATWQITTPYATSLPYNLINPYHITQFTENKFRYFDDIYEQERPSDFRIKTEKVIFDYNHDLWGHEDLEDKRQKYWNVVTQITFYLRILK